MPAKAIVKLSRDELDEVIRILTDHITSCSDYNCEDEAESTRKLVEKFEEAGKDPPPKVIGPNSTIEELLGNRPPSYLNVRTQNALYLFSENLEKWRKEKPSSAAYYGDLPPFRTVGDLTKWPKRKLLTIQNLGRKTIDYLERALEDAGYQFEDEG